MATLTQMRDLVTGIIAALDQSDTAELALVDRWINEGIVRVVTDTHCDIAETTISLTAGVDDYVLASTILELRAVLASDATPLKRKEPHEIDEYRRSSVSADPSSFVYALDGADHLMLYPAPSANGTLNIRYIPVPATLSTAGNSPTEVPTPWHHVIEFWALYRAAQYDQHKASNQGQQFLDDYNREIARMKKSIRRKGGDRNPRKVPGSSSGWNPPHDNSQDIR